jgi:hypothetical protein
LLFGCYCLVVIVCLVLICGMSLGQGTHITTRLVVAVKPPVAGGEQWLMEILQQQHQCLSLREVSNKSNTSNMQVFHALFDNAHQSEGAREALDGTSLMHDEQGTVKVTALYSPVCNSTCGGVGR